MDSVDEPSGDSFGGDRERGHRVVAAAQDGGDASLGPFLPHLAVGGSRDECLWMDAAGRRVADVGVLRVAPGAQGETGHQDQELGEPEDSDVCAGGGIRADSAVVDSGGAAFGKDDVDLVPVSGLAVRDFLGRDPDCGNGALLQGGDAEFAAGRWEDALAGEPGSAGTVYGSDAGWLGADVAAIRSAAVGNGPGIIIDNHNLCRGRACPAHLRLQPQLSLLAIARPGRTKLRTYNCTRQQPRQSRRTPKMGNHSNGCENHFECFLSKCCNRDAYKFRAVPVFSKKLPSSVTLNVGAPTFLIPSPAICLAGRCFTGAPDDFMLN